MRTRVLLYSCFAVPGVAGLIAAGQAGAAPSTPTKPGLSADVIAKVNADPLLKEGVVRGKNAAPKASTDASGQRREPSVAPSTSGTRYRAGEVIVEFKDTATSSERAALRQAVGVKSTETLGDGEGAQLLKLEAGRSAADAAAVLERSDDVAFAQRNAIVRISAIPNDEYWPDLWHLHNTGVATGMNPTSITADVDVDAPEAWDSQIGSPAVTIAVVDTGVDYTHPDLVDNMWTNPGEWGTAPAGGLKQSNGIDDDGNGYVDDFRGIDTTVEPKTSPAAANPAPVGIHGTHVAGIAGARGNNGIYISGVSQRSKILPVQAFNADGEATDADIYEGVQYAVNQGAQIVNGSFGSSTENPALTSLIQANPATTFVFAAGNEATNVDISPTYPCVTPSSNVICVGASTAGDSIASFSNYGTTGVDLSAPGVLISSIVPSGVSMGGQGIALMGLSGTSMATPVVAGAAAVLKSSNPTLSGAAVRTRLMATADPAIGRVDASVTRGRVNVANALSNTVPSVGGVGTVSVVSGELRYTAGSGASNLVSLSLQSGNYRISDGRVNITPGAGCAAVTPSQVSCPSTGITAAKFLLGDKSDAFSSATATLPTTIDAGDGDDFVRGQSGVENITGGNGDDLLKGNLGNDTINGGPGEDDLEGGDGADSIVGGTGDDQLHPGPGNDVASGGDGNDWWDPFGTNGDGDDKAYGGAGYDTIQTGAGIDELYAGDGDDRLHSGSTTGTAAEIVDGGNGNDEIINTDSPTQNIIGGAGTDTVDYSYPPGAKTVTIGATSGNGAPGENDSVSADVDIVLGSSEGDTLKGGPNPSILRGGDGDDDLRGGAGNATLDGGPGIDYLIDGPGNDTSIGGDDGDEFYGLYGGNDTYSGGLGADLFYDGPGNDAINGDEGNDFIRVLSTTGSDTIAGGADTDEVEVASTSGVNVSLDGVLNDGVPGVAAQLDNIQPDVENVSTGSGDDTITGSSAANVIKPSTGKDTITAGAGADTIVANDGQVDRINCGTEVDNAQIDAGIDLAAECDLPTITAEAGIVSPASVSLTTDPLLGASTDWIQWGATTSANRRKSGTPVIAGWFKNGSASVSTPTGSTTFNWTNAAAAPTTGSSALGSATGSAVGHGFRFTVPVTANVPVNVKAHVGLINGGSGQLKAWYTSNTGAVTSAPVVVNSGTAADRTFTIAARPSTNDTLTVEWALTASNFSTTRSIVYAASIYR